MSFIIIYLYSHKPINSMRGYHFFFIVTVLFALLSCGKEGEDNEKEKNKEDRICVTAGSSEVSETTAKLSGFANLTSDMTGGVTIGFVISEEAIPALDNGVVKTTKELNSDNSFSVVVSGLNPGTLYYYRAFVRRNDVYMYGETKCFKTQTVTILLNQSSASVSYEGGTLHLEVTSPVRPSFSELPDWINLQKSSYSESVYSVTFSVLPNKSPGSRTAVIVFTAKGAVKDETFTVFQEEYRVKLNERSDWSVRYVAREDWVNDDSTVEQVEHFMTAYNGNGYFIIRRIHPEDFKSVYNNDAAAFFTYEAESLLGDAKKDGVNFWQYTDEVFDSNTKDILYNRMRHGAWTVFLIELTKNGIVTGNYAKTSFNLQEEAATKAFSRWLGTWRANSGLKSYDLTITSVENNYFYRIEGWECGNSVSYQMTRDFIEGEFWAKNGYMYVCGQHFGAFEDADFGYGLVDKYLVGTFYEPQNTVPDIIWSGDLAVMVPNGDGAIIKSVVIDGNSSLHSIQFYMKDQTRKWHPFNTNVPALPFTMTRMGGTRVESSGHKTESLETKASIHRFQHNTERRVRNSQR